ncbi:hypothetical protein BDZ97DRAFT_1917800 [Flammula alnicola]|nr:hypothetical protein BDZ97DRAFT_1917800 [Flammula alnicola]
MAFLQRQRSIAAFQGVEKDSKRASKLLPLVPSSAAVENVPQKRKRTRTTSNLGTSLIMRRVSSMFSGRKKPPPPNLKLVNAALSSTPRRMSYSSSKGDSLDSDDDIRIPSGLGSAVTVLSNRSLPPTPFSPPAIQDTFSPPEEYQRTRAISSPNLLRSLSLKMRGKTRIRRASIALNAITTESAEPDVPKPPPKPVAKLHLPAELLTLVLSHLPRPTVVSCLTVSRVFTNAARTSLYTSLDFDTLSPIKAEQLVALLVSRSDLTDLVTTFICHKWPPFFLTDAHDQCGPVIDHRGALLTATFTLALERMSNLISLTLPAFDISLLAHHSAFGLKSLTFLNKTTTEAETKALFAWLDGQTNITSLRIMNIEDTHYTRSNSIPYHENTLPGTTSSSIYLKPSTAATSLSPFATPLPSPRSGSFNHVPPSPPHVDSQFASSTLLPNLTTLHATPSIALLLSSHLDSGLTRRPLKSVTLNINTTLYNGLRPAALMNSLRGITHLALRFSQTVDRRTFEKVLGAAGASLGSPSKELVDEFPSVLSAKNIHDPEWLGLRSLEIIFQEGSGVHPVRDEALYKSLQASLPRYKILSSLRLFILPAEDSDDTHGSEERERGEEAHKPSPALPQEQVLLDSWVKLCPSLESVTLFSGVRWQQNKSTPEA